MNGDSSTSFEAGSGAPVGSWLGQYGALAALLAILLVYLYVKYR